MKTSKRIPLTSGQKGEILGLLKARFEKSKFLPKELKWSEIQARLELHPEKLWSLSEMERTGGEPGLTGRDIKSGEYIFTDCSAESPSGRRSLCYDRAALDSRKEAKPANSVIDMAEEMGIILLNEEEYRNLQKQGNFDTKTSSWIQTPSEIRKLGGAIFADRRYNQVFVYHNGASSYYAARGFRGTLKV